MKMVEKKAGHGENKSKLKRAHLSAWPFSWRPYCVKMQLALFRKRVSLLLLLMAPVIPRGIHCVIGTHRLCQSLMLFFCTANLLSSQT